MIFMRRLAKAHREHAAKRESDRLDRLRHPERYRELDIEPNADTRLPKPGAALER